MISITALFSLIKQKLAQAGIDSSQAEAEQIISHFLKIDRSEIYLKPDLVISLSLQNEILCLAERRCSHYPLQYLLGYVEFYNSLLKVTPDVLIPRPETELLVDIILRENPQNELKVLDIGTGSGAIAISLKKARPLWQITASDISEPALNIAQMNANENNCLINFVNSDIFSQVKGKFDLIISNPPYISQVDYQNLAPELFHEPQNSLLAPDNGLYFFKAILRNAGIHLNAPAKIYFEIGADQFHEISSFAELTGTSNILLQKDYNNFPRFLTIFFPLMTQVPVL